MGRPVHFFWLNPIFTCARYNGIMKDLIERLEHLTDSLVSALQVKVDLNAGTMTGQEWRAPMRARIEARGFSVAEVGVLEDHASESLKSLFRKAVEGDRVDSNALGMALTHAFQDSLAKVAGMMNMTLMVVGDDLAQDAQSADLEDRVDLFRQTCLLRQVLCDLDHNYRMILPVDGAKDAYQAALDHYAHEIRPELDHIIAELPQALGLDGAQVVAVNDQLPAMVMQGREHIAPIPRHHFTSGAQR